MMRNNSKNIINSNAIISIVNYKSYKQCRRLLSSIERSKNVSIEEILIIDNSLDINEIMHLRIMRKKYYKLKINIIRQRNIGYSGGHNLSFKDAKLRSLKYNSFIVINPDVVFGENDLHNMLKSIRGKYSAAMSLTRDFHTGEILYSSLKLKGLLTRNLREDGRGLVDTDYLAGSFFVVRKSMLRKLRPFFRNFFMYWEDAELSIRIKKNGGKICSVMNKFVFREKNEWVRSKSAVTYSLKNSIMVVDLHPELFNKMDLVIYFLTTLFYYLAALLIRELRIYFGYLTQSLSIKKTLKKKYEII